MVSLIENSNNEQINEYREVPKFLYANLAKSILVDLRQNKSESVFFNKYTKEDIVRYLKNPSSFEKKIREACNYLYTVSSHFRRLINYFAKMPLFSYIVVPYGDVSKVNKKMFKTGYDTVCTLLDKMNIQHEGNKILTVSFREDTFYGYQYETSESYYIRQLPSDFCKITGIEDGVFNFAFDFSYFNKREELLSSYGDEFIAKYELYHGDVNKKKKGNASLNWQELDSKKTICIKVNEDFIYSMPIFAGVLEELFDIEDFKALQKAKTELDNTNILSFKIPLNDDKTMALDDSTRKKFYTEIEAQLPERVGFVITPFETDSYDFKSATTTTDSVAQAEKSFWDAAGVSDMNFNGNKSSSAAMGNSNKSDFDIVAGVLRQIERWINRKLKNLDNKYKFKIKILDVSRFNQEEMFSLYYKACQGGLPVKSAALATLGYNPSDVMSMGYLENDILKMRDTICSQPILSSSTMSPDSEGGKPKSTKPLSEAGEKTADTDANDNRD